VNHADALQHHIDQANNPDYHGEPLTANDYGLFLLAGGIFPLLVLVITGLLAW